MVMQVKNCCGCCSLKTGTIAIGMLSVVMGLLMIVFAFAEPMPSQPAARQLVTMLDSLSTSNRENERTLSIVMKIVMAVLEIILSIVLIIGAVKSRARLVYSWVVMNTVQCGLGIVVIMTLVIYLLVTGLVETGIVLFTSLVLVSSIQGYMILVVNSFHTNLISPPAYEYSMTKDASLFA